MTDDTRYDLWLTEVTDPMQAMTALTEALGDKLRAREAVLSTPSMLVHGATAEEMQALSTRLSSCGVTLEARPSRRAVPASPEPARGAGATQPPRASGSPRSPGMVTEGVFAPPAGARSASAAAAAPGLSPLADTGVAKVSFYAALVAAPAYVLQPSALLIIALLALVSVGSSFGALTGSLLITLGAPILAFVLRFGVFALIVRRSHAGQSDLTLGEDESVGDLVLAGARFVIVTLVALLPAIIFSWSRGPAAAFQFVVGGDLDVLGFVLPLLLLVALPLVALPGAYAATALGSGCGGLNPFIGLVVARRIPGAYFTTLAYLTAFWFASLALASGGGLLMFGNVVESASVASGVVSMLLVFLVLTLLDIASMVIAGRILGLLTYHYSEELGL
jgi:hypothetical protein